MIEPSATGWILVIGGILLAVSVLFSRASGRIGIPVFLLFLVLGMLAGSEGIGGIEFDDYHLSFRIGIIALALILFDGGLNTSMSSVRTGIYPAVVLSTLGVIGTGVVLAMAAYWFGFPWEMALLLGAIVSSTDAAAVFSTLRGSGLSLKRRTGTVLELESGLNDPIAVILTMALTYNLIGQEDLSWWLAVDVLIQLVIGGVMGVASGIFGSWLLRRVRLPAGGLYPVLTLALAFLAFGLATITSGSGFLSVYLAGLIIGNGRFPYRPGVLRFHDAAAWLSQVMMFLFLGLLAVPSSLVEISVTGICLGLFLALVARPLIVLLCLLPFRYKWREILYIGWVGLRGAVPIILAMFPVLAGVESGREIFDIVFVIVVFTALIPGGTVGWITHRLQLVSDTPPAPPAVLEVTSLVPMSGEVSSFFINPVSAVCGVPLRSVPLPAEASALLIVRGESLVVPRGSTVLEPGDHVYIFYRPEDKVRINLLFGTREE